MHFLVQRLGQLCLLATWLTLAAGGCGSAPSDDCAGSTACVTLALSAQGLDPALGDSPVLDDLELIVRVGESARRVRFDDRVLRIPVELPLPLPELTASPLQRVAVYARAHVSVSASANTGELGSQELGAVLVRPAEQVLAVRYPLTLVRACVQPPCAVPEPRRGAALAFEPRRRHLVLFGGRRQDGTALADTWEWDGIGWQRVPASSAPAARAGHVMALDARRGNLLLFGGAGGAESGPQLYGDTWEYLGADAGWRQVTDSGPRARHQAAMAAAPLGAGLILHGGVDAAGNTLGDTWLWDGQAWTEPPLASDPCPAVPPLTATLPRCRSQAALIPAVAPTGALLIGGRLGPAGAPQSAETDTAVWQWDGARWTPASVYRPPTVLGRYGHFAGSAAAASAALALVALGDSPSGLRQDSFVLDLKSGQFAPQLGPAPEPRSEAAAAYDDERDEVLLLGGRGQSGLLADSFSFTPTAGWRAHR